MLISYNIVYSSYVTSTPALYLTRSLTFAHVRCNFELLLIHTVDDDRPAHFLYPLEYDESTPRALENLQRTMTALGASLAKSVGNEYLYYTRYNAERDETFDIEFLLPENDNTVRLCVYLSRHNYCLEKICFWSAGPFQNALTRRARTLQSTREEIFSFLNDHRSFSRSKHVSRRT